MSDPIAILCAELAKAGVFVSAKVMQLAADAGGVRMTVTGKREAEAHLAEHFRLGQEVTGQH